MGGGAFSSKSVVIKETSRSPETISAIEALIIGKKLLSRKKICISFGTWIDQVFPLSPSQWIAENHCSKASLLMRSLIRAKKSSQCVFSAKDFMSYTLREKEGERR